MTDSTKKNEFQSGFDRLHKVINEIAWATVDVCNLAGDVETEDVIVQTKLRELKALNASARENLCNYSGGIVGIIPYARFLNVTAPSMHEAVFGGSEIIVEQLQDQYKGDFTRFRKAIHKCCTENEMFATMHLYNEYLHNTRNSAFEDYGKLGSGRNKATVDRLVADLEGTRKSMFLIALLKLGATEPERKKSLSAILDRVAADADEPRANYEENSGWKKIQSNLRKSIPRLVHIPGPNKPGCWLSPLGISVAERLLSVRTK